MRRREEVDRGDNHLTMGEEKEEEEEENGTRELL